MKRRRALRHSESAAAFPLATPFSAVTSGNVSENLQIPLYAAQGVLYDDSRIFSHICRKSCMSPLVIRRRPRT
jgi:hypothetical protein